MLVVNTTQLEDLVKTDIDGEWTGEWTERENNEVLKECDIEEGTGN